MPEAEATTGLAPEKASVLIDPLVATRKSPSEGFAFDVPLSLVKPPRSGGLGQYNAKNRRAVFARRSLCLSWLEPCSVVGIRDVDGLAQRWARPQREALHPPALALGLAGATRRLCRRCKPPCLGWFQATVNGQIAAFKACGERSVQALLDAHVGPTQPHPYVLALEQLAVPAQRVDVRDLPLLDVAQDRRQVILLAQRSVGVVGVGRFDGQHPVPPR